MSTVCFVNVNSVNNNNNNNNNNRYEIQRQRYEFIQQARKEGHDVASRITRRENVANIIDPSYTSRVRRRRDWSARTEIEAIVSGSKRAQLLSDQYWNAHVGTRAIISIETYRVAIERRAAMSRASIPRVLLSRRADAEVAFAKLDTQYSGRMDWTMFCTLCEKLSVNMSCSDSLDVIRDLDRVGFGIINMETFVEWYMRHDTSQGHVSDKIWTHLMTRYTFTRHLVKFGRDANLQACRQQFFESKQVGSRLERAFEIASRALKRYESFLISSRQGRKSVASERSKISREKRLRVIARFEFSQCDPDALGTTAASKLAERLCFDPKSFPLSGTVRCKDFEEFFVSFKSSTLDTSTEIARRVRSRRLMLELKWTLNPKFRRLAVYSLRVRERSRSFVQALTAMESGNDWVDAIV